MGRARAGRPPMIMVDGMSVQVSILATSSPDKIDEIYSHVATEIETRLLAALDTRWADAVAAVRASHQPSAAQFPPLLALPAA